MPEPKRLRLQQRVQISIRDLWVDYLKASEPGQKIVQRYFYCQNAQPGRDYPTADRDPKRIHERSHRQLQRAIQEANWVGTYFLSGQQFNRYALSICQSKKQTLLIFAEPQDFRDEAVKETSVVLMFAGSGEKSGRS